LRQDRFDNASRRFQIPTFVGLIVGALWFVFENQNSENVVIAGLTFLF
jgi:hypothetical protein